MASDTCLFQTLFQHEWCIHMTVSLSLSFLISRRNPLNYRIYLANSRFTSLYGISLSLQKNRLSALGNLNSISKVPLPVKCCIGPFSPKKKKKLALYGKMFTVCGVMIRRGDFITSLTELFVVAIATYLKYPLKRRLPDVSHDSSSPKKRMKSGEPDANPI